VSPPIGRAAPKSNLCVVKEFGTDGYCWDLAESNGLDPRSNVLQLLNPDLDCNTSPKGFKVCVTRGILLQNNPNADGTCVTRRICQPDCCFDLASKAGFDIVTLQALNPSLDCNQPNLVCISDGVMPIPPANPDGSCVVKRIGSPDYCQDLAIKAGIDLVILKQLNPDLDCANPVDVCVSKGKKVFPVTTSAVAITTAAAIQTSTSSSPRPPLPTPLPCSQSSVVKAGDNCKSISQTANVTEQEFLRLNAFYQEDCSTFKVGQSVCIASRLTGCPNRYTPVLGDSCASVASDYGLLLSQLQTLNTGVDCAKPISGLELCLGSSSSFCLQHAVASLPSDTCESLRISANLAPQEWADLNPNNNSTCSKSILGTRFCIRGRFTGCSSIQIALERQTCDIIASRLGITLNEFKAINVGLPCGRGLQAGDFFCIESRFKTTW
jgi:LysM repeat protein